MDFVSARIITENVAGLVAFYEQMTGRPAKWSTPDFAEVQVGPATLAIGSTRTVALFAPGSAHPATNRSVILEFQVADVDAVHTRLTGTVQTFVTEPTTMPWGNRSLLLRDPDGNLINLFTPPHP